VRPAPAVAPPVNNLNTPVWPERIAALAEAMEGYFRVQQQLHARTPIYVRENAYTASGLAVAPTAATSQPELIEAVVVSVAGPATLTLAETVIQLPGVGVYIFAPVQILLNPADTRSLAAAAPGALSLTLTGHQLPQWGNLS
jgi:hypothetical protein